MFTISWCINRQFQDMRAMDCRSKKRRKKRKKWPVNAGQALFICHDPVLVHNSGAERVAGAHQQKMTRGRHYFTLQVTGPLPGYHAGLLAERIELATILNRIFSQLQLGRIRIKLSWILVLVISEHIEGLGAQALFFNLIRKHEVSTSIASNQVDITLVGCKAKNLAWIKEISLLPSGLGDNYLLFCKKVRKHRSSHAHLFRIPWPGGPVLIIKICHNQKLLSGRYMVTQKDNVVSPALLHQF